ncbi:MAG: ABC transporter substrate-binding protein [Thermoguttaceae bacterium]|nr:ABC transporter substrate-binding protein [Thermoguttaceae bacterium]
MKFKSSLEKVFRSIRSGFCLVLLILISFVIGCAPSEKGTGSINDAPKSNVDKTRSLRIISTVPSVTETLFVLGLGDYVVGISDYCKYPEKALNLPKIGSLYDYNTEAIAELTPDFVVVLKENDVLPQKLSALGVETIAVDHSSLEGVLNSYDVISNRVEDLLPGTYERAQCLRREIEEQIDSIRKSVEDKPKVKTLISIYRTVGLGKIGEVYVAGHNPYFDSVLEIVGATNAAGNLSGASPIITAEGILELNPEAILDLSTDGVKYEGEALKQKYDERVADWKSLGDSVDAVKKNRVFPIFEDYATIPGPRTVLFLEELVGILHPDSEERQ